MKQVAVAGGVVRSKKAKIIIVSQNNNSWSLPKGHVDEGETELEAAQREIYEETGLKNIHFVKKLGTYTRYRIGQNPESEDRTELKSISMFLFESDELPLAPVDSNNPEARWVTVSEALRLLTHPKDKAFLDSITSTLST